jgi:hypothetical protein
MLSGASQADALQLALEFGINLRCKDRTWKLPLALNKSPLSTAKTLFGSYLFFQQVEF